MAAAADMPDVPAWLETMGAGMDAADVWPPTVTVDAPTMQTVGAILDAAEALGAEVADRWPTPPPRPAPTMPTPDPDPSKWNGSRPPMTAHLAFERAIAYANGERPALTVLPGGRPSADVDAERAAALAALAPDAASLKAAAGIRRRADARAVLAIVPAAAEGAT